MRILNTEKTNAKYKITWHCSTASSIDLLGFGKLVDEIIHKKIYKTIGVTGFEPATS